MAGGFTTFCDEQVDAAYKAQALAIPAAYGWTDHTADMPNQEILQRLLALSLVRAGASTP